MAKSVPNAEERLFACVMPTGIFYSDRGVTEHGDYKFLGRVMFSTLEVKIRDNIAPEFVELIKKSTDEIVARKGEDYRISTCGQVITLGHALK